MNKTFMIKFAWICNHEDYGEILSFIVSPKVNTYGPVWGYQPDKSHDEVIRFPSRDHHAISIVKKLAPYSANQWSAPTFGDLIEEEFDMDDFFEEYIWQDNYGKEVTFHTHNDCC